MSIFRAFSNGIGSLVGERGGTGADSIGSSGAGGEAGLKAGGVRKVGTRVARAVEDGRLTTGLERTGGIGAAEGTVMGVTAEGKVSENIASEEGKDRTGAVWAEGAGPEARGRGAGTTPDSLQDLNLVKMLLSDHESGTMMLLS